MKTVKRYLYSIKLCRQQSKARGTLIFEKKQSIFKFLVTIKYMGFLVCPQRLHFENSQVLLEVMHELGIDY